MEILRDYFALNTSRFAFITEKGRPVGWISPEVLMALIRPIHRDSSASKTAFSPQCEFLRVPNLSGDVGGDNIPKLKGERHGSFFILAVNMPHIPLAL